MTINLFQYLDDAVYCWPDNIAVEEPDGNSMTYQELGDLSDRMRDRLVGLGVRPGDRVGIWARKSIDSLVAIFGVLKTGAAYVPLDPSAPPSRNCYVLRDCAVTVVVIESHFERALLAEQLQGGAYPRTLVISRSGGGVHIRATLKDEDGDANAPSVNSAVVQPDDLAYILYTSGSTGAPKGVQMSHRNAVSFVDWCSESFTPTSRDRFSSHAPFHFDLSILDIYCSVKHGATLILIGEDRGKRPTELADLIANMQISVWYSAPSVLSLIAQYGNLENANYSSLRLVLFAGEVFPIVHLKSLVRQWPHPRYFNLYGPTETNVCTYYEVPTETVKDRIEPIPIGKVCSHLEGVVVDPAGRESIKGAEGELCIRGAAVTRGYWNLPEQSRKSFVEVGAGSAYYRTGDVVREDPDGNLRYLGRKDRMIKKRGFRVELGEIEVCLYRHPSVREAAVVALPDDVLGTKVHAHIACNEGTRLSLIELKTFCSENIPGYMIPDNFSFHVSLPKTSTDKVDYQSLKAQS
jgi:amino acid adenylation domain-containing protein